MAEKPQPIVGLRPVSPADLGFLSRLYASTRVEELAGTGWDAATAAAFCQQQFEAQQRSYGQQFPDGTFDLLVELGRPVGRLSVARRPTETRVIEISVLPDRRGSGIGTEVMEGLLAESRDRRVPVTVHVDPRNRALGWYFRLGFALVENRGTHLFLRHGSPVASTGPPAPRGDWQ